MSLVSPDALLELFDDVRAGARLDAHVPSAVSTFDPAVVAASDVLIWDALLEKGARTVAEPRVITAGCYGREDGSAAALQRYLGLVKVEGAAVGLHFEVSAIEQRIRSAAEILDFVVGAKSGEDVHGRADVRALTALAVVLP